MSPLPLAVLGLTVAIAVGSVPLSAGREPAVDTVMYAVNAVVLGAAGLLIGLRHPRHRVGLLLSGLGLVAAIVELVEGYGYHDTLTASLTAQWLASWGSLLGAGSVATLLALFPDGRSAGRGWRWLPAATVAATAAMVLNAAFTHTNDDSYSFTQGGNPYALDGLGGWSVVAESAFVASTLLAIVSLGARFRRSQGPQRQQIKLIFWFACLLAVVGPFAGFFYHSSVVVQWAIALRDLAGRSPLPVRVEAEPGPLPDDVVATAYFVAAEALTNVVKHAAASQVVLRAGRENGALVLTVRDDGVGGATPGAGSGLPGLADRVAALGGGLQLESPAGAGTTLTVRLPCVS